MTERAQVSSIEFIPTGAGLGAEVRGVSLKEEPGEQLVDRIKSKLAEVGVLLFRDQTPTEEEQLRFTRAFGEIAGHPVPGVGGANPEADASPEVFYLTNAVDGYEVGDRKKKKNIGDGTLGWHSDLQYMPEPQVYSLLLGMEVPSEGGETEYCNMTAAYEALDDEMKQRIEGLEAVHWFVRAIPAVSHPVVRTHPISGRKALYTSPGLSKYIEGMDETEGKALIKQLTDHATRDRFCWAHSWRKNHALMWDNRCTMHSRRPFDVRQRRVVRRTQTVGEPVVAAWA